jgi:hypothetical protein
MTLLQGIVYSVNGYFIESLNELLRFSQVYWQILMEINVRYVARALTYVSALFALVPSKRDYTKTHQSFSTCFIIGITTCLSAAQLG